MYDLSAFQRDVLYVIAGLDDKPHGLAIKAELEQYYDGEVNHAQLYPNLDTLVDKGLIEKGRLDQRTNAYSLSQHAERKIEARREWEAQYLDDQLVDTPTE